MLQDGEIVATLPLGSTGRTHASLVLRTVACHVDVVVVVAVEQAALIYILLKDRKEKEEANLSTQDSKGMLLCYKPK